MSDTTPDHDEPIRARLATVEVHRMTSLAAASRVLAAVHAAAPEPDHLHVRLLTNVGTTTGPWHGVAHDDRHPALVVTIGGRPEYVYLADVRRVDVLARFGAERITAGEKITLPRKITVGRKPTVGERP